ncbi:MAG: MFS transporter, partial [Herbiconiux sp.]|nr:MFS transporter [Herbiconiux sp.]
MTGSPRSTVLLVLAAIVLTALNLRTAVTGFSPLMETVGGDVGFGPALFGVFGTVVTVSFAVFGFAAAFVARQLGLERTLALATLATTAGILLRAVSPSAPMLVVSTVV